MCAKLGKGAVEGVKFVAQCVEKAVDWAKDKVREALAFVYNVSERLLKTPHT